ncbi:DUF6174 domain-containing protein [Streptomyces shenzhenensis]|uniref:DUF6174 domain-containing protein n=1 Tax=Streptomyces shenzhenensis TaxID=943815 RepID=UPI0033D6A05C
MSAVRRAARRALPRLVLTGAMVWAATACGGAAGAGSAGTTAAGPGRTGWEEPAAYTYTLTSSQGERALIGTFRVTVRDGEVVAAVGLDASGRRVVRQSPAAVPTLGGLLAELDRARRADAATAEADYAADGHPTRIALDQEENTVDDEALYVVSAFRPARPQPHPYP